MRTAGFSVIVSMFHKRCAWFSCPRDHRYWEQCTSCDQESGFCARTSRTWLWVDRGIHWTTNDSECSEWSLGLSRNRGLSLGCGCTCCSDATRCDNDSVDWWCLLLVFTEPFLRIDSSRYPHLCPSRFCQCKQHLWRCVWKPAEMVGGTYDNILGSVAFQPTAAALTLNKSVHLPFVTSNSQSATGSYEPAPWFQPPMSKRPYPIVAEQFLLLCYAGFHLHSIKWTNKESKMMRKNRTYPCECHLYSLCSHLLHLVLAKPSLRRIAASPYSPHNTQCTTAYAWIASGTLILNMQPSVSGAWPVVQWQDATGTWQDVEGWRGEVSAGKTIWWVDRRNGTQTFPRRYLRLQMANC